MDKRDKAILFGSQFVAGLFCFFIPKLIAGGENVLMINTNFFSGLSVVDYASRTICFLIGTLIIMHSFSIFAEKK